MCWGQSAFKVGQCIEISTVCMGVSPSMPFFMFGATELNLVGMGAGGNG